MKKLLLGSAIVSVIAMVAILNISFAKQKQDPCSITCYEKTPDCYVSAASSGCLIISNVKPKAKKGEYTCRLKSCKIKTTYDSDNTKGKAE